MAARFPKSPTFKLSADMESVVPESSTSPTTSNKVILSKLKSIMREQGSIINKWCDIGLELLDSDAEKLATIKTDNPRDTEACCTEMFREWLRRDPDASWNKLITTLEKIGLNAAAKYIKDKMQITDSSFHTHSADFTVVLTGSLGNGKSAACNFLTQKDVFKSERSFERVTTEVATCVATIEGTHIKLVDTPGLLDPCAIEKEDECVEFARALINIQCGFNAVGVVLNLDTNIERSEANLFENLMSRYEHYLPYIFLMFTHGKCYGKTDYQQNLALKEKINDITNHSNICRILKKINYRYLVIESIDDMEGGYHACKSKELLKTVEAISMQTGKPATNDFALSIVQSFNISENELETGLTEGIKVAVKECKEHKKKVKRKVTQKRTKKKEKAKKKMDIRKTKEQTKQLVAWESNDSSEGNSYSENEKEEYSNSKIGEEEFFKTVISYMDKALSKDKKITLTMSKDKKQTVTSLSIV